MTRLTILNSIVDERVRQDEKWGEQNHSHAFWTAILGEEFGEACQEVCRLHDIPDYSDTTQLKKELIQVAAVAVAWLEAMERKVV